MDLVELEDPFAMWFSSPGMEGTGDGDDIFGDTGIGGDAPALGGIWGSSVEGSGTGAETGGRTVLPGSSVWESMSGPIGSLGGGSGWAHTSPLACLGSSGCGEQAREERMDEL